MFRGFNLLTLASAILLAATFAFSLSPVFRHSPHKPLISFSPTFHVTVMGKFPDTGVLLFNDSYGPYRGSIISLNGGADIETTAFGEKLGIYYRHFRWRTGEVLWTFAMTMWYPIALFSLLPAIWSWRYSRARRSRPAEPTNIY